jgi:hypothetical protein
MKKFELPKSLKSRVKAARLKAFEEMSKEGVTCEEWDKFTEMYKMYDSMLVKTASKITPDTIVIAVTNIVGILLVLNFEKLDIVRSKAFGLLLKGRV